MRSSLLLLIAAILIAPAIHAQERLQLSAGTILDVTTLAEDIDYPTSVAIAPDGSAWVTDGYTGHIWRFSPGGSRELVGTIPLTLKLNDEANYGLLSM
jgi:streptogramin lyase